MRPRTSLLLAGGALAIIGYLAASAGQKQARPEDSDVRRSTFLAGPWGARGWADALTLLGVRVTRFRQRLSQLPEPAPGELLAVLDPATALSETEVRNLESWRRQGGGVLAAGLGAAGYFRCFGVMPRLAPGSATLVGGDTVWITSVFVAALPDSVRRSSLTSPGPVCHPGRFRSDTLLVATSGAPVALRVTPDSGAAALLVAEGQFFSNRMVRDTRAGEFTLGLVRGRYSRVLVDEYHQGFGPGGGIVGAARRWLASVPAGWAIIQLSAVGLIALLIGAVRFGPARHVLPRRRRSSLEHVHALATALAAADGRRVAVSLIVRGLRRRLARPGDGPAADTEAWLAALEHRTRTPVGRNAVRRLVTLTRTPAGAHSVREAALAVEDVWQDLTF